MERWYLAGPMRGLRLYGFNIFENGRAYLEWLGHDCVSPHQIDIDEKLVNVAYSWTRPPQGDQIRLFQEVEPTRRFTFERAMRRDIAALCTCDGIALLPGWADSVGARYEQQVNSMIGGKVVYVDPWVCFSETAPFEHANRSPERYAPVPGRVI